MWTLIRNGGVIPMLFIVAFGVTALLSAFSFAMKADRRLLGFVKSMAAAVLFATLSVTCADVGTMLSATSEVYERGEPYRFRDHPIEPRALLIGGLAESTSPGILGFSFLALTWMLVAVGKRRLDERTGVA